MILAETPGLAIGIFVANELSTSFGYFPREKKPLRGVFGALNSK